MPSAIPRRLAEVPGRSRASVLQVLMRHRRRFSQIHPAVVNRRRAGGWAGVLHKEYRPTGRGVHVMLEMRVRHIGYRPGAVELSGKAELALDDVPDLREVMPMQRERRARRVFEKSRIGFRRAFGSRVKEEFGDVAKSPHLPFHLLGVLEFGRVMRAARTHVAFSCFQPTDVDFMQEPSMVTPVTRNAPMPSLSRTGRSSAALTACDGTSRSQPPERRFRDRYRRARSPDCRRLPCTA